MLILKAELQSIIHDRSVTIHLLHRCIDLYSYDPTTSIGTWQVSFTGDVYRYKIDCMDTKYLHLIFKDEKRYMKVFFSTFVNKEMLNSPDMRQLCQLCPLQREHASWRACRRMAHWTPRSLTR